MARQRKVIQEKDPQRIIKLKECCDMLLAGGYFRARIATLSPFDKVVGGMVWSITASNVAVGVDILFQENSTIGDRIKLCENLVKAFIKMKCPLPIQSHQIQGLDYDNIYPVIQWLVRKVMETRALTGDLVRQLSESQFEKGYHFSNEDCSEDAKAFTSGVINRYTASRKYRKRQNAKFENENARIEATLLEYGEQLYGTVQEDEEQEDRKKSRRGGGGGGIGGKSAALASKMGASSTEEKNAEKEEQLKKAAAEEEKRLEELKTQLSEDGASVSVGGSNVGNIIGLQGEELAAAMEAYKKEMEKQQSEDAAPDSKHSQEVAHNRQVEALNRKIKQFQEKVETRKPAFQESQEAVKELKAALTKKTTYNARVIRETEKLEEIEKTSDNRHLLPKLKELVMLNESLKAQENQFKAYCKEQRDTLMKLIGGLETGETDDDTRRMKEIENLYSADLAKLTKINLVLAKKNQEIARITRAIDEIPTRAELLQFERRFVELYELVQDKLIETRKYYSFYNTLEESHKYMTNEVKLLESIIEGFPKAMKSKGGRESFLESFAKILDGVNQTKSQCEGELEQETKMKEMLTLKHSKLLEQQRKYFKAVKEFQEECYKNEKLLETLQRLGAS